MRPAAAWAVVLVVVLAGVPQVPVAEAATVQVEVKNYTFAPKNASIAKGDAVRWRWLGGTHNVLADGSNAVWCSTRSTGECTRTFDAPGNLTYHCGLHPGMRGWVFVDLAAPVVAIAAPAEGATVVHRIEASGTASHASGIQRVEVQLADGPWVLAEGGAAWTAEVDTNPAPNGPQVLRARAVPVSGPAAEASIVVEVANPAVQLRVAHPEDGATILGAALLAGTASHPFHAVAQLRWRLDGGPWADLPVEGGQAAKWRAVWDATAVPAGPHRLEFQARDGYAAQDSAVVARAVTVLAPRPAL